MDVSLSKTKSLTIAKHNIKCKIKLRNTNKSQILITWGLKYLVRDLKQEVRIQTTKASRISGYLNNLIWRNKHMSTECKVRIYKTKVRTVLTYASETTYSQQLLRTTELKIIRAIHGKTLRDKTTVLFTILY
jgi:hypothetical protein